MTAPALERPSRLTDPAWHAGRDAEENAGRAPPGDRHKRQPWGCFLSLDSTAVRRACPDIL